MIRPGNALELPPSLPLGSGGYSFLGTPLSSGQSKSLVRTGAAKAGHLDLAWSIAREFLSGERLLHTEGTAKAAGELASAFGADGRKAVVAAVLHDIARDAPPAELLRLAQANGIIVRTVDVAHPVLLHGRIAAAIAREQGILDQDILDAIAWHVTGRSGWTSLEEAVYLADKIEETRDYPGVQGLRELVRSGKPRTALLEALRNAITYRLNNSPFFVDPKTVVVFNEVAQDLAQAPEH